MAIQDEKVLLTGGAGFIGSHVACELLDRGKSVVILDNLSNAKIEVIDRICEVTGKRPSFFEGSVTCEKVLSHVFDKYEIDAVLHFAGLKSVNNSLHMPIEYYENNVFGTIQLLKVMQRNEIRKLLFSSSATVYGHKADSPIKETAGFGQTSCPYGESKKIVEKILMDFVYANPSWSVGILRYFNPVGAHQTGIIGEEPNGVPGNLVPYLMQVAMGMRSELTVFGDDYPTSDGSGVRDYIHVSDLAHGHIKALDQLDNFMGYDCWNLGTGRGYSVFEVIAEMERVTGSKIRYQIGQRRNGDIATCFADPSKAKLELNWIAQLDLSDMLRDAWNHAQKNSSDFS